ncbi:unnamed protein product [Sphenostylis stenocarpa]|uniref:Uncharacterized protein n=1 Tax=Sphenostylis stenocarpa TaxID=92480 RepID=A0AA86SRP8_9FABA|nr:unnamed protein product [Sphenostylis stenocarpa]
MGPKPGSDMKMNAMRSGIVILGALAFGYLNIQIGFKPYLEQAQNRNALYQSDPSQEKSDYASGVLPLCSIQIRRESLDFMNIEHSPNIIVALCIGNPLCGLWMAYFERTEAKSRVDGRKGEWCQPSIIGISISIRSVSPSLPE